MRKMKCLMLFFAFTVSFSLAARNTINKEKALIIDYNFSGGTPITIEIVSDKHYRIKPITKISGSQFFYTCFRINNFRKGEILKLELVWPSVAVANDFPAGTSPEVIQRQTQFGNFASVVPDILYYSYDQKHWNHIPDKATLGENGIIQFSLKGNGKPLYFSTQVPFTYEKYQELLEYVTKKEPAAVKKIGDTQRGEPMYALDFVSKKKGAETIFIQALQHGNEFTAPLVADAMIHYLLDNMEGKKLREKYAFQFIPVFDVDYLHYNLNPSLENAESSKSTEIKRTANPNRDWITKTWVEVNNVDRFIDDNLKNGTKYQMGFDLHNGWGSKEESGGCYLAFTKKQAPEAYIAKQFAFNDFMIKNTDHITYREPLAPGVEGLFFGYFYEKTGALSMLIEFSRFEWWNRKKKAYTATNQDSHVIYAIQAINAISQFEAYYNTRKNTP